MTDQPQQQPTAAAMEAANAFCIRFDGEVLCKYEHPDELTAIIDRETGLPGLIEACKEVREWIAPLPGESPSAQYDRRADAFYYDTGMMAPGKDVAAAAGETATYAERNSAWRDWLDAQRAAVIRKLDAALAGAGVTT